MSNIKKLMMSAAGGAVLDVNEVFSTYVYAGQNDNPEDVTDHVNGINLSEEGGMVWFKNRTHSYENYLFDTERGVSKALSSNTNGVQVTPSGSLTGFNTNGYETGRNLNVNKLGQGNYVSWTFRKAPKFFDVVTYTGNNTARTISHNLGTTPGLIICKCTSGSSNWKVWHRSLANGASGVMNLNLTGAETSNTTVWNNTLPTDSVFSLGTSNQANETGLEHVAYLFAHNDGDGGFGPDGDQDIIKCGSYNGNGSITGPVIDLGFEPQWVMIKNATGTGGWVMLDSMRGWPVTDPNTFTDHMLFANTSNAEFTTVKRANITSTGFQIKASNSQVNTSNNNYIYMAIRRGPLAPPESATEVFAADLSPNSNNPRFISGFVTDLGIQRRRTSSGVGGMYVTSRLTQNKYLHTGMDIAESSTSTMDMDYMNGFDDDGDTSTEYVAHMWKRAPGFFDVVAYNGDATSYPNSRAINHNLGVAPEMMWIKCRTAGENWAVYHSGTGATKYLNLNSNAGAATSANWWRNTTPTDTVFTIGHQDDVNLNGGTHIAYLFATLPGISKVGSYTGNGTNQNIDCGFTSGARFILIKPTDAGNAWYVWDSTRGIVAGNDPFLLLNTNDPEITSADYIDPYSGGFNVTGGGGTVNQSGKEHIFYAIA